MSDAVMVALIGAASLVTVAVVQLLGQRTLKREVREVHKSTVNSHDTDLRHDVDRVQTDVTDVRDGLTAVQTDLTEVLDMVRRVPRLEVTLTQHMAASESIVGQLKTRDRKHEESITDLHKRAEKQATAISDLAKALPIVARSTPAPEDTSDPEED